MNTNTTAIRGLPRRRVVAAGLGAMALALPRTPSVSARVILLRGMSGGGMAQIDDDTLPRLANFGLFASAQQLPDGNSLVLGRFQWLEAGTDLQLQSIEVTQCVQLTDRSDGAEVRGRLQVNAAGDYPFIARSIDGGAPGSALDRIEIEVNTPAAVDGADPGSDDTFTYEAAGNLVAGDFQWIINDIPMVAQ
jgi:hypothetical protein